MDIGSIVICITLGALICFVFFGAGMCLGKANHRNQGQWLKVTTANPELFCNRCSECGYEQFYADKYNYCPKCGAKMK